MGRDLHSPSLVAPKDLKHAHDEYVEKVNRQRVKEQREANRRKAEADQAKFEELKGRFIELTMTDGTIRLNTLDSVADYYDEGTKQHICVGQSRHIGVHRHNGRQDHRHRRNLAEGLLNRPMPSLRQPSLRIHRTDSRHNQRQQEDDCRAQESIS